MQMIVHLPTTDGRELVLTRYTEPEPELSLLPNKLKLELPAHPLRSHPLLRRRTRCSEQQNGPFPLMIASQLKYPFGAGSRRVPDEPHMASVRGRAPATSAVPMHNRQSI